MSSVSEKSYNMTVSEVIELNKEMGSLLAEAQPDEREYLLAEFAKDPTYSIAITGVKTAIEVLGHVSNRIDSLRSTSDESSVPYEAKDLLAELDEDHEQIAAQAEQQKKDIADIHNLLDSYDAEFTANGGSTKAQRAALKRYLNGECKIRWSAEQLADDPMRLKSIMDSVYSKTGISDTAKYDVKNHILDNVKKYIVATTHTVDPDTLNRRIEASLLPGLSSEELQKVLLGSYFRTTEMYADIGLVVDSYERFIRGAIRLANKPEILRQAMRIASFETHLLPEDGLYAYKTKSAPLLRLEQPELFGRTFACLQSISILMASLDALDEISPAGPNRLQSLADYLQKVAVGDKALRANSELTRHYNRLSVAHMSMAIGALGEEEYQKRTEAIGAYVELYRDPGRVMDAALGIHTSEQSEPGIDFYTSQAKYVARYLISQNPELEDFFRQIFETDYAVSAEASAYIGDQTIKMTGMLQNKEFMAKLEPAMRETMARMGGKELADIIDETDDLQGYISDVMENQTTRISRRTDDGYVVELFASKSTELSDHDWLDLLEQYHKQIERAKKEIARTTGIGRRAVNIGDSKENVLLVVREESLADKQAYHPLDAVVGEVDEDGSEDRQAILMESLATIEDCRLDILADRRRFLNNRGITWQNEVDDAKLVVNLHKHPRNPQNFICEFIYTERDKTSRAKVLMNPELLFELGDRKVRDTLGMAELNTLAAEVLAHFMCQEAVESEEGVIGDEKNTVTARIAHLRLLPEDQKYSYQAWSNCLQVEGLDLEVLSDAQQAYLNTERKSTYVSAVERDDVDLGPIRIYFDLFEEAAA